MNLKNDCGIIKFMFKCQVSKKQSRSGEKSYKLVTKTRPRMYTKLTKLKNGDIIEKVVSEGNEIVEELTVCEAVFNQMKGVK